MINRKKERDDEKKAVLVFVILVIVIMSCAGCGYDSDEKCAWCGNTPTKQIESDNKEYAAENEAYYYCEHCSTVCNETGCDNKVSGHYTNMLGLEVFLCDEHMKEYKEDQ